MIQVVETSSHPFGSGRSTGKLPSSQMSLATLPTKSKNLSSAAVREEDLLGTLLVPSRDVS